jgi:class 3 adenylate cyclase/CHAT domain-containing protein
MLMEKFSRTVTIMFTDIKGSTSYYETRGDLAGRTMIHQHNSIVMPIIEKHKGTLLKTIGDATMSIYELPADGLRAATEIQTSLLAYNKERPVGEQIKVRCGLNCGIGLVEDNDVYGDVVNVTARIESLASAGDIYISEQIYSELRSDEDFIFRFVNAAKVKGKDEPIKVYRLVWNAEDLKLGTVRSASAVAAASRRAGYYHLEATLSGNKLKVSGSFQVEGEVQPVKQSQDITFDRERIEADSEKIIALFGRAGESHKVSRELLDELVQTGKSLYAALIPDLISKGMTEAPGNCLLISIDEALVGIPWEVLYNGSCFLCHTFGIGRSVTTKQTVSGSCRALVTPLKMLLLCDPQGNLPAAARERQEILTVTKDSQDHLSVTSKEAPVGRSYISGRIHSFDIVHYAGHAEETGNGGWLLHDGALTADTISTLSADRPMPALVFSNACHSGKWQTGQAAQTQRIFSLANAFLLRGVQHFIGTLWDIPDEPGRHFAAAFYTHLVQGKTIGESMLHARHAMIETFGEDTIFWGSYLLYGDPTTRYVTGSGTPVAEKTDESAGSERLLRSAETPVEVTPPGKSHTMMIAGGLLIIGGIVGGYLMTKGAPKQETPVIQNVSAQSSAENDRQTDELVKTLAASFRSGDGQKPAKPSDGWTTPPFSIVIMEISGGSGSNDALIEKLNQGLANSAGVSIVERKLLNKMLAELKLSASALTDPATSIKLGKILSARIMVSGTISADGGKTTLMLKFIDTETTEVRKMLSSEVKGKEIDTQSITDLTSQIGTWIKEDFPVQGKITATASGQAKLNIGRQHGLKKGDVIEAVVESGAGSGIFTVIAELLVTQVDNGTATVQITGGGKGLALDIKVRLKR